MTFTMKGSQDPAVKVSFSPGSPQLTWPRNVIFGELRTPLGARLGSGRRQRDGRAPGFLAHRRGEPGFRLVTIKTQHNGTQKRPASLVRVPSGV